MSMSESPQRLKHLHHERKAISTARYSRFVRRMKIILPLIAAGIVGLLMVWPQVEDTFEAIPKDQVLPQTIGKNELLNPRYESEDDRQQPFTITADRAIQSSQDPGIVMLDRPKADITLTDGTWIASEALQGTYNQNAEQLLLEGQVKLFHDQGYEMSTEKMLLNLQTHEAWSDRPVSGHGPAGTLEASGLQAQNDTGRLIFTGPAKLVLNRTIEGL